MEVFGLRYSWDGNDEGGWAGSGARGGQKIKSASEETPSYEAGHRWTQVGMKKSAGGGRGNWGFLGGYAAAAE